MPQTDPDTSPARPAPVAWLAAQLKPPSFPGYRADIDGLRAVAVLSVLLFHVDVPGFAGGFVGVDVFFVISGFLITRNILKRVEAERFSFKDFFGRRVRRLFPALLCTLLCSFVVGVALLSPPQLAKLGESTFTAIVSMANAFFWYQQDYFATGAEFNPLLHTWSLSVEEQFYLLWPAVLVAASNARSPRVLNGLLIALGLGSLAAAELWRPSDPDAAFYLTPFRVFEFTVGALCVGLSGKVPWRGAAWANELAAGLGLALILASVVTFSKATPFPGLWALLPCVGAALVILSDRPRHVGRLLDNPVAVRLGLLSYSIYLVHWPVLVYTTYWTFAPITPAVQLGVCVASLVGAFALYVAVEQPLRHSGGPRGLSGRAFAALVVPVALALMAVSLHASLSDGWYWRLDDDAARLARPRLPGDVKELYWSEEGAPGLLVGAKSGAPAKVLVIGDSHAEHLKRGLAHVGRERGLAFRVWAEPYCVPLLGVVGIHDGKQTERCADLNRRWREHLAEARYDLVILAARWHWYVEPGGSVTQRGDFIPIDGEDQPAERGLAPTRALFEARLAQTGETLQATGARVLLFSQVPLGSFHQLSPQDCLDVPRWLLDDAHVKRRCLMSGQGPGPRLFPLVQRRTVYTDRVLTELASQRDGVSVFLPFRTFCPEDACVRWREGVSLYKDDDHLSDHGSVFLAEAYAPMLLALIGQD